MQYLQNFSPTFLLLQQEGYLIRACLTTGLTELRSAHIHNKGAFYSSLFNLSTGLERLLKSIVIMDHMIKNNLTPPTKNQLIKHGHFIAKLYDKSVKISASYDTKIPEQQSLPKIEKEIIKLLSDFAQASRYHNLDALSNKSNFTDPLEHWNIIFLDILDTDVTKYQKEKILRQAQAITTAIDDCTITIMQGLDQKPVSTAQALTLPGLHEQAAKFAVYRIIKVLIPLRDLISDLSHRTRQYPENPFPEMQSFLNWICDDRKYVLRKHKWP